MYPVLKEGVSVGTFQYEGSDATHYFIENADGQEFEVSHRLWKALLQADGTRPLNLPDNGRKVLPGLKKHGFVRTSRFVRDDDSVFNRLILFPVGNRIRNGSPVLKAINGALPLVSVLFFAISVFLMKNRGADTGYQFNRWIFYSLLACSVMLHEAGHMIAALAYGYRITDTGILLLGIIPVGAYVAHEDREDATKAERIQLALAGVEADLLIAGICLLLAMRYDRLALTMTFAANFNVVLAGINLLPAPGLDGESALSAACGVNSISAAAKRWLLDKKHRGKLLGSGLPGYACLCVFAVALMARVLLWVLIDLDVASVFFNLF